MFQRCISRCNIDHMTATIGTHRQLDRRVCRQTGVRLSCTYWLLFVELRLSENENVSNIKTLKGQFGACHTLCSVCVCACVFSYVQVLAVPRGSGRYDPGLQARAWKSGLQRSQSCPLVLWSHTHCSVASRKTH